MDFNAKQMREDALIKEGRYKFLVADAREKRSTTGNDMLNLTLSLEINGRRVKMFDSLILIASMFWKVEHFCKATGLEAKLDEGRLMACDCIEAEGYVDIVHKIDKQTGELTHVVRDYVKRELLEPEFAEVKPEDKFDDDIPSFV